VVAVPCSSGSGPFPVEVTQVINYTKTAGTADVCSNTASIGETYTCPGTNLVEGNSLLYLGMKYMVKGELLPSPLHYDLPPLLYWIRYFFTGYPIPIGGRDVMLHPVAWPHGRAARHFPESHPGRPAGWRHVLYAVFGKRVAMFSVVLLATWR